MDLQFWHAQVALIQDGVAGLQDRNTRGFVIWKYSELLAIAAKKNPGNIVRYFRGNSASMDYLFDRLHKISVEKKSLLLIRVAFRILKNRYLRILFFLLGLVIISPLLIVIFLFRVARILASKLIEFNTEEVS